MEPTSQIPQVDLDKLFHYSTPSGFNGIVKSKTVWMTNIQYQNDIEEYNYALKLTFDIINEEYPGITYTGLFADSGIAPVYTFSFTEKGNLLSQWRGYSPNGGFSFAFDKDVLQKAIDRNGLELVQCIYDIAKQKEYIRSNVLRMQPAAFLEMQEKSARVSHDKNTGEGYAYFAFIRGLRALGGALSYHAARLKHPKFAEEREWRLIKRLSNSEGGSVKLREGKDILIPYIEVPLVNKDEQLSFSTIVVGPGPRQELARQACMLIPSATVISSDIPYRNW